MIDLSGRQRDALYVVAGRGGCSGQDVKRTLERYGHNLSGGAVYPFLDELERRALVRKEPTNGRANRYWITSEGWGLLLDRRFWESAVGPRALKHRVGSNRREFLRYRARTGR